MQVYGQNQKALRTQGVVRYHLGGKASVKLENPTRRIATGR